MIEIQIEINGITKTYKGDYDEMHNVDWNHAVQARLDEVVSDERGHLVDDKA